VFVDPIEGTIEIRLVFDFLKEVVWSDVDLTILLREEVDDHSYRNLRRCLILN
jgi:hypothetical protein